MLPSYTQDNLYPSYQDRLLIKSLGVQAGVVEENDFKVTAGAGLQVEVEKGKGFVAQTNAIQEAGTFYNGLYNILNPTKQNPYNTVEVPTTNPQIAQIILRVYDVSELGIGGASYGRIEWLNGTPNAGATKAHVEEEKASEFGAAALPTSSYRCVYVVVPKNATVSSEYSILDRRNRSQVINKTSITGEKLGLGTVRLESESTQNFVSWGLINESGSIINGSGDYTASRTSTGLYQITWKSAKTSLYSVNSSVFKTGTALTAFASNIENARFNVETWTKEGANANSDFSFNVFASS